MDKKPSFLIELMWLDGNITRFSCDDFRCVRNKLTNEIDEYVLMLFAPEHTELRVNPKAIRYISTLDLDPPVGEEDFYV